MIYFSWRVNSTTLRGSPGDPEEERWPYIQRLTEEVEALAPRRLLVLGGLGVAWRKMGDGPPILERNHRKHMGLSMGPWVS